MKKQRGRNRMKRMGAVLLSVFCVLAAVLVLQTSGQPESGEHVAQAATSPASEEAATQAGNAGGGQDSGRAGAAQATGNTGIAQAGTLTVTWLDVGQGDAAVIQCGGQSMLIDGGKPEKSSYIYAWLQQHGLSYLDVIVATHVDADHIGGLSGALNYASVGTAYCPETTGTTETFQSFVKYLAQRGKQITVPTAGETFALGGAQIQILGPLHRAEDSNDNSIVLKVSFGATSFLFTGDAERAEEQDLLNSGVNLQSTVLKVGHHGSDTSTSYPFLRAVAPQYAVISVGAGNSYGHPTEAVLSRLRDAGVTTFRTDMQGEITAVSDGQTINFSTAKNAVAIASTNAGGGNADGAAGAGTTAGSYVLNTNSHKFHLPSCSSVETISPKNRKDVNESREQIISEGYAPCKRCNP
ncbi:ComEC/Rec2 family competence protein [Oribacterium sp. HCP3S3_B9]|uniref:ComEC/Rec2 family competence protein n=1 Tax=Oribacterium sp. HCP3S3_B9 TaxID=3438946 RepID=UPI003F88C254